MGPLSGNCNKFRRFIAGNLGITSSTASAVILVITCLTILAMLSDFSCNSPNSPTPPSNTRPAPSPTGTLIPTVTLLPTSTLLPPVTIERPEDGSCIEYGSEVTLWWSYAYELQAGEYYRLKVWAKGQEPFIFYSEEKHLALPVLAQGDYKWAIIVVRSLAPGMYEQVSEESTWHSFRVVPSPPVVHSISPTSTLQGTSVSAFVNGENFTASVALTIGVPLQVTFVNSSTITVTVPSTLEVGVYAVTVQDSNGKGISSASFTVEELLTETPIRPSITPTPRPYPPPAYAPPVLEWGGIIGCNVTFRWQWSGTLAENEWFAVRVGKATDVPHSQYWGKGYEYTYSLSDAGSYVWEIAICRGDPATAVCSQLAVSERHVFSFGGCSRPDIDNAPPCRPPDC